jgi:hypothetical protein
MHEVNRLAPVRTYRRSLLSAFALLTIFLVAAQPLPLLAANRTTDGKKIATTTKLKSSASTVKEFSKLSLTASVSPSKAKGTVAFYGSPAPGRPYIKLVTYPVVDGVAKATALHVTVSGHVTFKAVYSGSAVYGSSTSNVVPVDITK